MRKFLAALLALAPMVAAAQDPAVPIFTEQSAASGLTTAYLGDWQYMVGGGAAVFDCDADGRLDVFLAGGEGPAGLYRTRTEAGGDLRLEPVAGMDLTAVAGG